MLLLFRARLPSSVTLINDPPKPLGYNLLYEYNIITAKPIPKRPKASFLLNFTAYTQKQLIRPTLCITLKFCFNFPKRNPYMD